MFLIPVVCPRCSHEIKIVERKRKTTDKIVSGLLCKSCKEKSLEQMRAREQSTDRVAQNSVRMKNSNPMANSAEARAKMVSTKTGVDHNPNDYIILKKHRKIETKIETSDRMKTSNPMHSLATVAKQKSTVKARIESGEIIYASGPEHHLWKGNRDFNNSCRRDLYPTWVFPILSRDNFTCTKCGSSQHLQVHHLKPLRSFINEIKVKYNISSFTKYSTKDLYPYVQEVVIMHKLEDGVTVCASCHAEIDEMYHSRHS